MDRAVEAWRLQYGIEKDIIAPLSKKLCKSYTVYGCMLLLPQNALEGPEWSPLEPLIHHNNINNKNTALNDLYKSIAKELKITHIASNKPIPLHHHPHHPPPPANVANTCNDNTNNNTPTSSENILRAPINFTPLYGDFGPETCSQPHPTQEDFDKAFWVTAKQNGIYQVWAPRWTMFSRGNISEKARLLTLGSVREAVEDAAVRGGREGGEEEEGEEEEEERELQPPGFAAIDLYAGIGYFAFSYLRAGADQVWCWDINPWSIEGLLRGAKANKWEAVLLSHGRDHFDGDLLQETATTSMPKETPKKGIRKAKLLIFNESNIHAPERLQQYLFPPPPPPLPQPHHHSPQILIRHINLGLLPSSRESLSLAAQILSLQHQHQQKQVTSTSQKEIIQKEIIQKHKSRETKRKGSTSWIHMHENFLLEEILAKANERSKELEEKIHGFLRSLSILHYQNTTRNEEMEGEEKNKKEKRTSVRVKIEGINRLKSYAPGVMHCVVDFGVEFLEEEGEEGQEGQEEEEGGEGEDERR